jgi:hypothetical protein
MKLQTNIIEEKELEFLLKAENIDFIENMSFTKNGKNCIFDIVVFKNENPVVILKTKNVDNSSFLYGKPPKIINEYNEYNLPIIICSSLVENSFIIKLIKKILNKTVLTKKDKRYKNMKIVY